MKYSTNKNGNLELTFTSPINVDNGFTNVLQGEAESSMELYTSGNGTPVMIEWDVPELEMTEHIGLFFDGRTLEDYDGVFELPIQAIKLIRKAGWTVPKFFEEIV